MVKVQERLNFSPPYGNMKQPNRANFYMHSQYDVLEIDDTSLQIWILEPRLYISQQMSGGNPGQIYIFVISEILF